MNWELHPEAELELNLAARYYKATAGIALAEAFVGEFERVASLLVECPLIGTPLRGEFRRHTLRRFPYKLIYRPLTMSLYIHAVAHQHRHQEYWRGRAV